MKSIFIFLTISITSIFNISCTVSAKKEPHIGLCFSGGGGKGAYEIGVWKALDEYRISQEVSAVSGTSVGALNAALFVNVSQKDAEHLWKAEIGYLEVLTPDISKLEYSTDSITSFLQYIQQSYETHKSLATIQAKKHPLLNTNR